MDFGNALLVSALLFALVEFAKGLVPAIEMSRRLTVLAVLVAAQVAVFGLSVSVWANEQVIGGHTLDKLNTGSKIVAGLFLAAGAGVIERAFGAVKNIGDNQPRKPIAK